MIQRRLSISGRVFITDSKSLLASDRCNLSFNGLPSLEAGDIVIKPIITNQAMKAGRYQLSIFDGKKLRFLLKNKFPEIAETKINENSDIQRDFTDIKTILLEYKGREVVYRSGYHLKVSQCSRCGWCCIEPFIVIADPNDITGDKFILKPGNIPCPHLEWSEVGEASCKVHNHDWFYETSCYKHKCELSYTQCKPPKKATIKDWFLSYYPKGEISLLKEKFDEIFKAAESLNITENALLADSDTRSRFYRNLFG